ncbi:lipase family protein [Paenibacillus tundrae]|uniref:lipase family protein n=1 Tax=Paenibacillus tundrae TaxID=528187 RepID=UPI0030CDC6BC
MKTYISDEMYLNFSKLAYQDISNGYILPELEDWKVVEPGNAELKNKVTGFDALVIKNQQTDQVVISYRGTEPDGHWYGRLTDYETDVRDVIFGRTRQLEDAVTDPNHHNIFRKSFMLSIMDDILWENNQFNQAEKLYESVNQTFPDADISLTGHSLGGGLAQYVAARKDVSAMTYSAPSVTNLLDDISLSRVNEGYYDGKVVNVVDPNDSVGAGGIVEYDRHVGSTFYRGQDFDSANAMYQNWKLQYHLPIPIRSLGAGAPLEVYNFPVNIDLDKFQVGNIYRLLDSFSKKEGKGYHSMDQYEFDTNGNLVGPLINRATGEEISISPRWTAHEKSLSAIISGAVAPLVAVAASAQAAAGKIQLTPEELAQAAKEMRVSLSGFSNEVQASIQMFQTHISTSESQSFTPIAYNATATLERINRWYQESISEIAEYIERKHEDFVLADEFKS